MRLLKRLALCLLATLPGLIRGQSTVAPPQVNVSGNVGCIGFPCVNTGTIRIPSDADYTMPSTLSQPFTSASSVKFTSAVSLTATRNIIYPAGRFPIDVENATSGGQAINICGPSGACVPIPNDATHFTRVWNDGTNYVSINSGGGGSGGGSGGTSVVNDVTGFRAYGTSYQNTNTVPLLISVTGFAHGLCTNTALIGLTSSPAQTYGAQSTFSGGDPVSGQVTFLVPPNYFYEVNTDYCGIFRWTEATLPGGGIGIGGAVSCSNLTLGLGAGTGATCSGVTGLDGTHFIDITTGTSPTAGATFFTFTFSASRGHNTYCVFSPIAFGRYTSLTQIPTIPTISSATGYQLQSGSVALDPSTVYEFQVSCP